MFCGKCGASLPEDAVFCKNCSSTTSSNEPVIQTMIQPDGLKKNKGSGTGKSFTRIIAVISVLVVVTAAILMVCRFMGNSSGSKSYACNSKYPLVYVKDGELYKAFNDKDKNKISDKVSSDDNVPYGICNENQTGEVTYFFDTCNTEKNRGDFYYIKKDGVKKRIASDVNYGSQVIANDGKSVMFMSDYDSEKEFGELYIYYIDGDKKEKIASEAPQYGHEFSPGGHYISFCDEYDSKSKEGNIYIKKNGMEKKKVGSGMFPFSVSDDGQMISYLKFEAEDEYYLYMSQNGKEAEKLASDIRSIAMNSSMKQIIVVANWDNDKGDLYVWEAGKDKEKIDSDVASIITYQDKIRSRGDSGIIQGGILDKIFYTKPGEDGKSDLYVKQKSGDKKKIAEGYTQLQIAEDGNTCAFLTDWDSEGNCGTLNIIKYESNKPKEAEKVSSDVNWFNLSNIDGKFIYYSKDSKDSDKSTIYVKKEKEEPLKVSTDSMFYSCTMKGDSMLYYKDYNSEKQKGDLYKYQYNKESIKIATDVNQVKTVGNVESYSKIFYLKDRSSSGKGDLYYYSGREEKKVDSDVSQIETLN